MKAASLSLGLVAIAAITPSVWAESAITKTADGIEVYVDAGVTNKWAPLFVASGLTNEECTGLPLIKKGLGCLDVDGYGVQEADLNGIYIEEGQYIATSNCELGRASGAVYVRSGATLILDGSTNAAGNDFIRGSRAMHIAGHGTSREYPAVRIEFTYSDGINWYLDADASMYNSRNWGARFAGYAKFYTNGHTLTLDGISDSQHQFAPGACWSGGGGLVVKSGKFITTANSGTSWVYYYSGNMPFVRFEGVGSMVPSSAEVYRAFPDLTFADSSGIAPSAAIDIGLKYLTGMPTLTDNVNSLEVTNRFTVVATELMAAKQLTLPNGRIAFADGCELVVSGIVPEFVMAAAGTEYVVADAGTIAGTPTLVGLGAEYYSLVKTDTQLKLVRKAHTGNYVMFAEDLDFGALNDGDQLLVGSGEYCAAAAELDLTALTAQNVTLRCLSTGDAVFKAPIRVGAAAGLTLDGLMIADTTGPAVVADGATALTIKNLKLKNVTGAWTDGKNYPFAFTGVTDLMVTGCTYEYAEAVWDAQAVFDGGSQRLLSAVQAGVLTVEVGAGAKLTWAEFAAQNGLKDSAYAGLTLCKVGAGEFDPDGADFTTATGIGFAGLEVREGRYRVTYRKELGEGTRKVLAGGTMIWDNSNNSGNQLNGKFEIAGSGSSTEYPALRIEGAHWGLVDGVTWNLTDDATMFAANVDATFWNYATYNANGHFLTLAGKSFTMKQGAAWSGGGGFIIEDGTTLNASTNTGTWIYRRSSGDWPQVILRGAAVFQPMNADCLALFKDFTFEDSGLFAPTAAMAAEIAKLKGVPTLGANLTALTINESFTLTLKNLKNGECLTTEIPLVFGEGSTIGLEAIDADLVALPSGYPHTIALAGSITGTPTLTGVATELYTLENNGTELTLVRKEHSENFVAYTDELDFSTLQDGDVVAVASGDWRQGAAPLDLSALTAKNVTVKFFGLGEGTFHGGIVVGAAEGLTLDGLTIANAAGPAVVASGATALTLKNLKFKNVAGAWTDGKNYPFAFTEVTDLMLSGCAAVDGSANWDAQAYLSGGTQLADCEARDGAIVVQVGANATRSWDEFAAGVGLKAEAIAGKPLYKVGAGRFAPTGDGVRTAGIQEVYIQNGQYVVTSDATLGVAKKAIHVADGATLVVNGLGNKIIEGRRLYVAGTGSSPEYPAVRIETAGFGKFENVTWCLDGDTTVYNLVTTSEPYCDLLAYSEVLASGHTLTLTGVPGAYYNFRQGVIWYNGGKVVVGEGVRLLVGEGVTEGFWMTRVESGAAPVFEFQNGASFEPSTANDIFNLVKLVKFLPGSSFKPQAGLVATFDELTGAPTMSENVYELVINKKLTALNADLVADRFLAAPGVLTFGDQAVLDVDSAAGIVEGQTAFTAVSTINGKPARSATLKAAGLTCQEMAIGTWSFVSSQTGTLLFLF